MVSYDNARWTLAQSAVPFAVLAGIVARRIPSETASGVALLLLCVTAALLLRARRSMGTQTLVARSSALHLTPSAQDLSRRATSRWTLRSGTARLHGSRVSYKLRLIEGDATVFEAALTSALGRATTTVRRGSPRARGTAGAVLGVGLVLLGIAITLQNIPLLAVGLIASVGGGATLGALSQRVMRL